MKKQNFCPECLDLQDFSEVFYDEDFNIKNETIKIESRYLKCNECSEEILVPGYEDENYTKAYNIYREQKNLIFPKDIKDIRDKYLLSQRLLAKILGWSHTTLSRYETGALQSISHNNQLILIKEPRNLLTLLEVNKNNISIDDYKTIKENIFNTLIIKNINVFYNNKVTGFASVINTGLEKIASKLMFSNVKKNISHSNEVLYIKKEFRKNINISIEEENITRIKYEDWNRNPEHINYRPKGVVSN